MTFLAPLWIAAAVGAAGVVVVLHLFARRRPPREMLPTARFIPPHSAQATTRTIRPTDLLLLLLRVLLLLAIGAAMARPVLDPPRAQRVGIVLADISRATPSATLLMQRLNALRRPGDIVIPFDSAPHVALAANGTINAVTTAVGSLSTALLAALKARRELGAKADSVDLTIISAVRDEEIDHATDTIRALWPGRIMVDRLAVESVNADPARIDVRAEPWDPIAAAVRLFRTGAGPREVRIVRGAMQQADSAWASDSGRVLIHWPALSSTSAVATTADTAIGVVAGDAVVVAPFVRSAQPDSGAVVARWADGRPAATERVVGNGCIRHVVIATPARGDLTLRPEFGRLLAELSAPCIASAISGPAADAVVERLRGKGAPATAFASSVEGRRPLAPWFLAFALLLSLVEPFVRRRKAPV